MFFIGGLLEVVFCSTNFYQIYNIGESEKKSDEDISDLMKRYQLRQKIKESKKKKKQYSCTISHIDICTMFFIYVKTIYFMDL
ncbi:hypothetical protein Py17XNL_000504443 [Plasmodium yoelii yoelii]|uniref:Uncharacterized protein n=1 Tax=Plasmodium yoelii yoelii TaxID=73239 RepID=A0AAE9WR84_PLAYO|nr:hypothetical protein Py17XNL_000504443 [Plasmodium yoelii yoelii]